VVSTRPSTSGNSLMLLYLRLRGQLYAPGSRALRRDLDDTDLPDGLDLTPPALPSIQSWWNHVAT
jgi:hypothetical protein